MTTVLRLFWPRFVMLGVLLLIGLFLGAGVSLAQEAGPITVDQIAAPVEDYTGLAGLANSALAGIASALALLIGAIVTRLWNLIPVWAQAVIDKLTTSDSVQWRENIREAALDGLMHATVKLKIDPKSIQSWEEKNAMLALAGQFIERFDPDIKALIDKDGNGIPDVLEIALAKIAPQTALITPPPPTQGFMERPIEPRRVKARASDAAVELLASKFARQAKGAVKQ